MNPQSLLAVASVLERDPHCHSWFAVLDETVHILALSRGSVDDLGVFEEPCLKVQKNPDGTLTNFSFSLYRAYRVTIFESVLAAAG